MVGIEKITDRIISDAEAEAARMISEARAACKIIESETQQKKQRIEEAATAEAEKECESIKMRAKSSIAKHKRDIMLSLRANMTDEAFEEAIIAIVNLDAAQYRSILSSLMAKVLCERVQSERDSMRLYGEDISADRYEILMNKKDREAHGKEIIDGARRAVVGKLSTETLNKIILSNRSINIEGGFIVKCGDVELNCTVRTIVEGVRRGIEGDVTVVLFGDKKDNQN